MIRVNIDGVELEFPSGGTVLDALRRQGNHLPHLCHDDRLAPAAVCRMCLVLIDGALKPVPSCSTPLLEGMVIRSRTPELEAHRRSTLGLLAVGHPCGATAERPDKPLHRAFARYGIAGELGTAPGEGDDSHPYLQVDFSRCIHCYRCVRICSELQGQDVWSVQGRGSHTRIVAGTSGSLLQSACVSCGACADACPSGALEDKTVREHGPPTSWTRTICSYCGVGCGLDVGTREGRITTIRPVLPSPVSRGHLCSKGRYAFGFVRAQDRAQRPMLRRGGLLEEVSWEEALGFTADAFARILGERGPQAVGVLGSARATNEENYLAQKFARVVLGTHNVDSCARVCHGPTAAAMAQMLGTGAATNSFDDIEQAKVILLCGANATENHPVVGARIKQAVRRGAKLIVVDPRRIELADLAQVHLAPRPGTNVTLFNAMAQVIFAEGLADRAFLAARVDGVDALCAHLSAFTPERAAQECGVLAEDLRQAARLYAKGQPAMSFHGLGLTEHEQGTEGVMGLVNLALLTGNLGRRGSGVNPLRGQNNVQGSAHMGCEPHHLTGYIKVEQGRAAFEAVWRSPLPRDRGLDLMEMIDASAQGRFKALLAIGHDVLLTNPDLSYTRRALGALELLVVQDLFLTETARELATVFFPAACAFEKDGTFMNSERRVQRVRRALLPPGGAKTDLEILCDLAQAMGAKEGFSFGSAQEVWEEVRSLWSAGAGISYPRIAEEGLQWPCPDESHPGTKILHQDPDGPRAHLRCLSPLPPSEVPDPSFPLVLITGRTLHQYNAGTMTGRTRQAVLRPTDTLDVSPADAGRLRLCQGERIRVRSRHGETVLPVHLDSRLAEGTVFASFQTPAAQVNRLTGQGRDGATHTPQYKVTAVRLEKLAGEGETSAASAQE